MALSLRSPQIHGGIQCKSTVMADDEIDRLRSALAHAYEERMPFARRIMRRITRRSPARMEEEATQRIIPPAKPEKKKDAA